MPQNNTDLVIPSPVLQLKTIHCPGYKYTSILYSPQCTLQPTMHNKPWICDRRIQQTKTTYGNSINLYTKLLSKRTYFEIKLCNSTLQASTSSSKQLQDFWLITFCTTRSIQKCSQSIYVAFGFLHKQQLSVTNHTSPLTASSAMKSLWCMFGLQNLLLVFHKQDRRSGFFNLIIQQMIF